MGWLSALNPFGGGGGFSGGGAFNKNPTTTTTTDTENTGFNFSEVARANVSTIEAPIDGNGNTLNVLDGGAIAQAFDFAGQHDARQLDVLEKLIDSGSSLYEAHASNADQASNNQKLLLIVAGAFVIVMGLQAWGKQ